MKTLDIEPNGEVLVTESTGKAPDGRDTGRSWRYRSLGGYERCKAEHDAQLDTASADKLTAARDAAKPK